jgi:hypothetical protein
MSSESIAETNVAISAGRWTFTRVAAGQTDDQIYALYAGKWRRDPATPTSSRHRPGGSCRSPCVRLSRRLHPAVGARPLSSTADDRELVAEALAAEHERAHDAAHAEVAGEAGSASDPQAER